MNTKYKIVATVERYNTTWNIVSIKENLWGIKSGGERITFSSKKRNVVNSAIDDLHSRLSNKIANKDIGSINTIDTPQESGSKILTMLGSKSNKIYSDGDNTKTDSRYKNIDKISNLKTKVSNDTKISKLETRIFELEKEVEDLKNLVNKLIH